MASLLSRRTKVNAKGLFMLVLGPSKAGKSYFMGTQPEGNILHLHGSSESHGSISASAPAGDRAISVQWERGDKLIADIMSILSPETLKAEDITCIGLDSLTELFRDIRDTKIFKQKCTTASGKHNNFKESEAMIDIMSKIIHQLRVLYNEHNINVICAMHARVTKVENDVISEVKPELPGFGVAEFLVGQFNDILVLNHNKEKGVREFVSHAVGNRDSKNEDGIVTRYLDFTPCLQNASVIPDTIEATIPALLKLKNS